MIPINKISSDSDCSIDPQNKLSAKLCKKILNDLSENNNRLIDIASQLNRYGIDYPPIYRLLPVIFQRLKESKCLQHLDALNQTKLHKINIESSIAHTLKKNMLERTVEEFTKKDISIILLKGMAFNDYLYSTNSPRLSSDIDILVRPKDKGDAKNILAKFMSLHTSIKKAKFDSLYEDTFVSKNPNQPHIDLHYHLVHPTLFPIESDILWAHSIIHPAYNNEKVRMLSPEHNLIHLALHCLKDLSFINYSLFDALLIINKNQVDIGMAFEIAKKWNASHILYFLLTNLNSTFGERVNSKDLVYQAPNFVSRKIGELIIFHLSNAHIKEKSKHHRFMQVITQLVFSNRKRQAFHHFIEFIKR
jgi:hypothetical protein